MARLHSATGVNRNHTIKTRSVSATLKPERYSTSATHAHMAVHRTTISNNQRNSCDAGASWSTRESPRNSAAPAKVRTAIKKGYPEYGRFPTHRHTANNATVATA